jgi:hypothetical protein
VGIFGIMLYRQRRCSHSHCSGYSRTQPSITAVTACMVPATSKLPSASRAGFCLVYVSVWPADRATSKLEWPMKGWR